MKSVHSTVVFECDLIRETRDKDVLRMSNTISFASFSRIGLTYLLHSSTRVERAVV